MMDHETPPNWVSERAKCNLDLTFKALCEVVERDVAEMNKLSAKRRRGYVFELETNGEGLHPRLSVRRFPDGNPDSDDSLYVMFEKSIQAIRITVPGGKVGLASPRWLESANACRMFLDNRHFKVWELSQYALGPLFFEFDKAGERHAQTT